MCSHSSCLFDTGQSLLVDFGLCVSTRLVFIYLWRHCQGDGSGGAATETPRKKPNPNLLSVV